MTAVADEIAGAANLAMGKTSRRPVSIVRGLGHLVGEDDLPGAASLVRPASEDMFRLGSAEAASLGYTLGLKAGSNIAASGPPRTARVQS